MTTLNPSDAESSEQRRRNARFVMGVVLAAFVGIAVWVLQRVATTSQQPNAAIQLYQQSKYADALRECEVFLKSSPDHAGARAIAGLSAWQQRDFATAQTFLANLPPPTVGSFVYHGWLARSEIETSFGRIENAVADLSTVLSDFPQDALVLRRLATLSAGTGDTTRAVGLLRELVDLGHASAEELMVLAAHGDDLWSLDRVRHLREMSPDDRYLLWAEWKHLRIRQRHDAAIEVLNEALAAHPQDPDFRLAKLELTGILSAEELHGLDAASEMARFWMLLSRHFEPVAPANAIGCAVRSVEVDRFNEAAHRWLAELLRRSSRADLAELHQTRVEELQELFELCRRRDAFDSGKSRRVVALLESLGRYREAVAWCRTVLRSEPQADWASKQLTALQNRPFEDASKALPSEVVRQLGSDVVLNADPAHVIALAIKSFENSSSSETDSQVAGAEDSIRFADVAQEVGLDTRFYNGANAVEQGRYMHEFTGGGVGVLDVDGDTWPDLFFPQGADQPEGTGSASAKASDELHRNIRGQHFESIADVAGISDSEFGQGVAIADLNSDGFDDIYVTNVRRNVMWINQGDGTFERQELPEEVPAWTISAAVLDINGDSYADIYDVNYVAGDDVFERLCDYEGLQRVCSPTDFDASPDELWIGNGDGTFRRGTIEAGLDQFSGRGMGVIAGDILGNGSLQLLVANDESANFFLEYDAAGHFRDSAHVRGIAFGRDGTAQGSMGIAAGRLTPKHRTDLFITNYYGELNCFHEQTSQGFFIDSIGTTRLEHPGRPMLGFGTQFLDADADGDDDLFVANGHLDDFEHMRIPYRMSAQFFINDGGRFRELRGDTSPYLMIESLGRAVARLDWNRDGAMDLCVTHLDRKVALLENRSEQVGTTVMLKWTARSGHRDAVGTMIKYAAVPASGSAAGSGFSVPILAGDGYECSNERIIQLALPAGATEIHIQGAGVDFEWTVEQDASELLRIVEGDARPWMIPR